MSNSASCYFCSFDYISGQIILKKFINGKIANFSKDLVEIPETHRQQLKPAAYIRNGSIYASKRNLLIKGKRYGTRNSIPYIMDSGKSINIDTEMDLMVAKQLLKKR